MSNINELQRIYAASNDIGVYNNGLGSLTFTNGSAAIPKREQLLNRKNSNLQRIEQLTEENKEIEIAISLLDQNPILERLDNLFLKIFGRNA